MTGREYARVATGAVRDRVEVEPLTNYFVGRAQHALGRRASIGFLGTAVVRDLDTPSLDSLLVDRAFVGGVDGHVFLDEKRDWVVSGGLSGSTVSGSQASVLRLQRAAPRYYQRPDAPHVSVDPTATSLSGWSGRVGLNKNSGNVTFNAGLWGISPGFEPNDLGFATQTDRGGAHGQVLFRKLTPDAWTRTPAALGREVVDLQLRGRVPGRRRGGGARGRSSGTTGSSTSTLGKSWNTWDDKLTRGGPTTIRPGIEQPERSSPRATPAGPSGSTPRPQLSNREFGGRSRQYSATLNLRPVDGAHPLGDAHVPALPHRRPVPLHGARRDRHRDLRQPLRLRRARPGPSGRSPSA